MTYAIWAYNSSIHSVTGYKPLDVVTGHVTTRDPFDIKPDQIISSNYVSNHKENTKVMYQLLNRKLQEQKSILNMKQNEVRQDPISYENNPFGYVKTGERSKTAPKFKRINIISNELLKVQTDKTCYPKAKLLRPKKFTDTQPVAGPSSSSH